VAGKAAPGKVAPGKVAIAKRPRPPYLKARRRPPGAPVRKGQFQMLKALLRLLSMVLLAVAVIMAVLDATRSIAAGAVVLTPLRSSWMAFSPQSLTGFEALVRDNLPDLVWDPVMLPGFAIFAALWLPAALAGRRRASPDTRYDAA
jgi:hypothetical protein